MVVHPLNTDIPKPERFTYPFNYEPHPLCQLAAKEVQAEIARINPQEGKMFGVLVVSLPPSPSKERGSLGFLAAYSGLLEGRNDWPYFVPPVYDAQQPDGYFKTKEREISMIIREYGGTGVRGSENSPSTENPQQSNLVPPYPRTPEPPKQLSQDLQTWLFHQYQLLNARGEVKDLVDIWQDYYDRPKLREKYPLPPGGTGDCCAPKLLQYAYQHGLKPVCMAEFWWGPSTKTELRQHLNYYPACRGKCKPLLTWMLQGLDVDPDPELQSFQQMEIPVVYEDDAILVVNKPSGMLSVPGRVSQYSVETVMQQHYPDSKVAHRLDMGTSGLLIVAKTPEAYRALQEQFVKHQVKKKYLALLEERGERREESDTQGLSPCAVFAQRDCPPVSSTKGRISLPLRPDPMNRPRQVVDMEHGKRAVTDYEFLNISPSSLHSPPSSLHSPPSSNIVALYPQTGRTHQLRIHCAHPDGLGRPIVGDELYGTKGERLMLHAAELWFTHPVTGEPMHLECEMK